MCAAGKVCLRSLNWSAIKLSRAPLAPWPETPPQLTTLVQKARALGVSFAVRGNLIILAPPLVIEERELSDALALLDRLLSEMESA